MSCGSMRGAETVGTIDELPPLEARVVRMLRLWCESLAGQAEVWNGLAADLGAAAGSRALRAFEAYLLGIAADARRPLQRHGTACRCLGADEATLVLVVRLAAAGERQEATLVAALLVGAKSSGEVAGLAADLAAALAPLSVSRPPRVRAAQRGAAMCH